MCSGFRMDVWWLPDGCVAAGMCGGFRMDVWPAATQASGQPATTCGGFRPWPHSVAASQPPRLCGGWPRGCVAAGRVAVWRLAAWLCGDWPRGCVATGRVAVWRLAAWLCGHWPRGQVDVWWLCGG